MDTDYAQSPSTAAGAEAKREATPWEQANTAMAEQIASLGNTIDHLFSRLDAALNPAASVGPSDALRDPSPPGAVVVTTLRDHTAQLAELEHRLIGLRDRVEV